MNKHQRPWGYFEILLDSDKTKVKRITVHPSHRLSYQKHLKRQENWVIIQGTPTITLNDETYKLKAEDTFYIPREAKHRISNPGKDDVIFIEVQTGDYFGEEDIIRFEDDYNRT